MVVAELGTTYDSDGGLYDWIREAFGDRWGSRVAWYYWINFPLWIASLATLFPPILGMIFGADIEANIWLTLGIEIAFVWIVVFMSFSKVSDSAWILNGGAVLKVLIAVSVGARHLVRREQRLRQRHVAGHVHARPHQHQPR